MFILIMGITHTKALVLNLTTPAASKRNKRRIATYPLLTTWGFHQRRLGIATETTMLAGNRLGFHAVISHGGTFCGGVGAFVMQRAHFRGASRSQSLYPMRSFLCDHLHLNLRRPLEPAAMGVGERTR